MPFHTVAVLGAGLMGSQIAAHLANAGLDVDLLDLPSPQGDRNQLVEGAFHKAGKLKPPIFYDQSFQSRVRLGNYEDHFDRLAKADWIIEAVVEKLDIKQDLMKRIEAIANPRAVISTNTSGLPISEIAAPCSLSFRKRFLGTHFFNPPRYLKLLELIPSKDTDPWVLKDMKVFAEKCLGKGVVIAKDTPNFIANRIGMYVILQGIHQLEKGIFSIPDIDAMTGVLVGRPKSATFRTADLVGLDTISYVAQHLYQAVPEDEQREIFQVPSLMEKLVSTGSFGAKSGQGFYKKIKGTILNLNTKTYQYETPNKLDIPDLKYIRAIDDLPARLMAMFQDNGPLGQFFKETYLPLFAYCSHRIPEISDSPADLDQAMRWGFGWQLGPFEMWDILGFHRVLLELKQREISVPSWIQRLVREGYSSFYEIDSQSLNKVVHRPMGTTAVYHHPIDLKALGRNPDKVIWHNSESALLDLGDGVVLFEFRSKGNTLSLKVLEGLTHSLDLLAEHPYSGMVIGNRQDHFSGGANLIEMGGMAQKGDITGLQSLIVSFQGLLNRINTFPKPIVAAVQGRALGGGCELVLACPHVVAAAETYIGLVEMSVGLIPGAGGITRLLAQLTPQAFSQSPNDIQPYVVKAFETIAMAKVSSSAYEAKAMGYLKPCDPVVINGDRRLEVAKEWVMRMHQSGYMPPSSRNTVKVLGQPGKAVLMMMANQMLDGHFISEYDHFLAGELAYVLTGGNLTEATVVPESYLLKLERERFIPLLSQPKTQARIEHLLRTKKPLRN